MGLTVQQAEKIVADVQVAHRLVVAYYQRLLPEFDAIAAELDLGFWHWEPLHTASPGRPSSQPTRKWLWDMVPLFASRHVYWRVAESRPRRGDYLLSFELYADDGFRPEQRKQAGIRGEPNALTLPQGQGLVEVLLYRCIEDSNDSWDAAWKASDEPDLESDAWQSMHPMMDGRGFIVRLSEFICDKSQVLARLKNMAAEPLPTNL